jgi:ATP/maltotriose-dependent transcriptional regulator MalT
MLATALEAGPTPVEKSILECEELVLWRGSENPGVQPILAHLRSMLGEFDVARSLLERARRLLSQRYRARRPVLLLKKRSAQVAILAGDLPGAESELRDALEHSLDMGTQETSEIAALLSRVLTMQGDPTKAAEMAETSERHAPSESVSAQALWRVALAQAEVARGNPHEGERLVRESIGLVPAEMLNLSADLRVVLAQVLASGEQRKRASAAIQDAISLYELKGNVVGAREARSVGGFMAEPMASG